jgi:hypothetical protein
MFNVDDRLRNFARDQKSAREAGYRKFMDGLAVLRTSDNPKAKAIRKRHNDALLALAHGRAKALTPGANHVDALLNNIAIQSANGDLIGTEIMPVVPVAKRSDKYAVFDKRNRMGAPDDALGPRATANEVFTAWAFDNYSVRDYGLKGFLDKNELDNQDEIFNQMVDVTEQVAAQEALRRELRIVAQATNPSNYGGNTLTLGSSVQWDSVGGGDPVGVMQAMNAGLWSGNGAATKKIAFTSLGVLNVLAKHVAIRGLFQYQNAGLATPDQIARFFGWDSILVSEARQDTANEGQNGAYSRIWGNVFGVVRVAQRPTTRSGSFGATFRAGPIVADNWFEQGVGVRGGYYVRNACSEDHKIMAADMGFLVVNPVSSAAAAV